MRPWWALALTVSLCGCGGRDVSASNASAVKHVALVVLKGHSYEQVIGSPSMPYLNELAAQFGVVDNYFANQHGSLADFLQLATGREYPLQSDGNYDGVISATNLVRLLHDDGKTWKAYLQSLPVTGYLGTSAYPYTSLNNPFAYLSDVVDDAHQPQNMVPLGQLASDLANDEISAFAYIAPDEQHNLHDCPLGMTLCDDSDKQRVADDWLRQNIAPLLANADFRRTGVLVLTFDEGDASDMRHGGGHVATIVAGGLGKKAFGSPNILQHQNTLYLILHALGIQYAGMEPLNPAPNNVSLELNAPFSATREAALSVSQTPRSILRPACDGSDAAADIRAAIESGAPDVVIPNCPIGSPQKYYLLSSYDNTQWHDISFMFKLQDRQTVSCADGVILKIADGALNTPAKNGGSIFLIDNKTQVTIENCRIDMNGANNLTPSRGYRPAYAILASGGTYNTIRGNEILNSPGRNGIAVKSRSGAPSHYLIENNTIQNGGTTIPGNRYQNDYSAIYCEASYCSVSGNRIINDAFPVYFSSAGGIELHGNHSSAIHNIITNAAPGVYINTIHANTPISDVTVADNRMNGVYQGINFFPTCIGSGCTGEDFESIFVHHNDIKIVKNPNFPESPAAIQMPAPVTKIWAQSGILKDSSIHDNVVSVGRSSDGGYGFILSNLNGVKIRDNTFTSLGRSCINMLSGPFGIMNVEITGNKCVNWSSEAGTIAIALDLANDDPPTRANRTAYALYQYLVPGAPNGFTYEVTQPGITGDSPPIYPTTLGASFRDGTAVLTCRSPWSAHNVLLQGNSYIQHTMKPTYSSFYVTAKAGVNNLSNIRHMDNTIVNVGQEVTGAQAAMVKDH